MSVVSSTQGSKIQFLNEIGHNNYIYKPLRFCILRIDTLFKQKMSPIFLVSYHINGNKNQMIFEIILRCIVMCGSIFQTFSSTTTACFYFYRWLYFHYLWKIRLRDFFRIKVLIIKLKVPAKDFPGFISKTIVYIENMHKQKFSQTLHWYHGQNKF